LKRKAWTGNGVVVSRLAAGQQRRKNLSSGGSFSFLFFSTEETPVAPAERLMFLQVVANSLPMPDILVVSLQTVNEDKLNEIFLATYVRRKLLADSAVCRPYRLRRDE
jgi:hypothetical protein